MSINNKSKEQTDKKGKLTDEFLGKHSPDVSDYLKKIEEQKKIQKDALFSKMPTGLTKAELEERQADIDKKLNDSYPIKAANPAKELGKNGIIASEHKDKLAFIFIGDTNKADKNTKSDINSPKISMVIGGGLEAAYNRNTGEQTTIDPKSDYIIGVSAQLHMISLSDIDVTGILPISTLKNRSTIRAEADALELSASEIVIIRSLGRPYNSSGTRVMTPGGVHIISGQNFEDKKIREPEPMVLGKGLSDTLIEIIDKMSAINSTLISTNEDLLQLKASLLIHTHPPFAPPSPDLVASVTPTIVAKTVLNITNGYSTLVNLEILKTNKLTPLSKEGFLSQYNRVN